MVTVYDIYSKLFSTGDFDMFKKDMKDIGSDISDNICVRNLSTEYINTVLMISKYLEVYGLDYNFSTPAFSLKNITDTLNSDSNYMRLTVTVGDIINMAELMTDKYKFPDICNGSKIEFNGKFITAVDLNSVSVRQLMIDAVTVYLYGFPIREGWLKDIRDNISYIYMRSECISHALLYIGICSDWLNKMLCEMSSFNLSANDWCCLFDNILFDLSKQDVQSFVSFVNPRDNDTIVCVSKVYPSKYFVCSFRIFNILYENGLLDKIRFTDRVVKVHMYSDGSNNVVDRTMNVPVYFDDNNDEVLVSSIAGNNFEYHEIFTHDVGKGY